MKTRLSSQGFSIQELMDASPAIISVIDTDKWKVGYQNRSGRQLLGEIDGKTCYEAIPKQPSKCGFCRATEALQTGKITSSEVPMPGGQWLLVQWAPIRSGDNVLSVVETITDITETKKREQEYRELKERFQHLASIDPLTELLNRRGWLEKAERIGQRAAQDGDPIGVLIADVDHFKRINDAGGHAAGDQVLRAIGARLHLQLRPCDVIGRWGGEEFIILLPPPCHEVQAVAERLRQCVEGGPMVREAGSAASADPDCLSVTVSLGGATAVLRTGALRELEDLIQTADRMLYRAKAEGRNRVCLA